jgi:putative NADH-flavin reductase
MAGPRIVVFGATGQLGRHVVGQALARGAEVTAFVRPGSNLPERPGLRIVAGQVTRDLDAVRKAVRGSDAVVSALGNPKSLRALRRSRVISEAMRVVVPAMEAEKVRRVVWTSALGAGPTWKDLPPLLRLPYRLVLGPAFRDKEASEALLTSTGLDWTLVHPVVLTEGEGTGRYRAAEHLRLRGVPKVARADVATFILDEVESPRFVRRRAELAGTPRR